MKSFVFLSAVFIMCSLSPHLSAQITAVNTQSKNNELPPKEDRMKEVESKFYFDGHPINPRIINEFNGWLSDGPPIFITIDLAAGNHSNRFFNYATDDSISYRDNDGSSFGYKYEGKTDNGIYVVRTWESGGGSGVFEYPLFFSFKIRKNFDDYDGYKRDQLLMTLEKNIVAATGQMLLLKSSKTK